MTGLRMAPDGVMLEIALVQFDEVEAGKLDEIWKSFDQQAISISARRLWDRNGLQVASAPAQLPASLQEILNSKSVSPNALADEKPLAETLSLDSEESGAAARDQPPVEMLMHGGMTFRQGKPRAIAMSETFPSANWVIEMEGNSKPGRSDQVTAYMQLTCYPKSDGTVRIVFRPLLRYGEARSGFGVSGQSLVIETAQSELLVEELKLDAIVRPGQTIILGATSQPNEFGRLVAGQGADVENSARRFLFVRLLQSQRDDLFDTR